MTNRDTFNSWLAGRANHFVQRESGQLPAKALFFGVEHYHDIEQRVDLHVSGEGKSLEEHGISFFEEELDQKLDEKGDFRLLVDGSYSGEERLIVFIEQFIKSSHNDAFISPKTCIFIARQGEIAYKFLSKDISLALTVFESQTCNTNNSGEVAEPYYEELSSNVDFLHEHISEALMPRLEAHLLEIADNHALHKFTSREKNSLRQQAIKQIRSEEEAKIRREVHLETEQLKAQIIEEHRNSLIEEIKMELRPQVAAEIRDELMKKMLS